MNFKNFIEEIKRMLKEALGDSFTVEEKTVLKNNGVKLTGIVIMEGEQNCVPNIYLNAYYDQFKDGRCMRDIVYEIVKYYEKHKVMEKVDMDCFSDYEKIKGNICYRLINYEKNKELLEQIPHITYLDLAIVFFCVVENESIGSGSILIRNEHIRKWKIDTKILHKQATSNTSRLFKGSITAMEDVICEIMTRKMILEIEGSAQRNMDSDITVTKEMVAPIVQEMMQSVYSEAKGPKMYVAGNQSKNYGAATILYESFLDDFANKTNSDYYILPSSIHEVILIPVSNEKDEVLQLKKMVYEVNRTELEAEEFLSDTIYLFKRNSGIITKAE